MPNTRNGTAPPEKMSDDELMFEVRNIINIAKNQKYLKSKITTDILKEAVKRGFIQNEG